MTATLKTVTLGCKVNQYETEYVREGLSSIGFRDARQGETADLCLVNTCTVTSTGDAKSRQVIRRLARENPGTRIIVMGCYATRARQEVEALPAVSDVLTDKRELPDLLGRLGVSDVPRGISGFGSRHRAYVKIQDGCMLKCSYCVIPQVRPRLLSRDPQDILDEARRLIDNGYRELVLTGIHLGHYGVDFNRGKLKPDWVRLSNLVYRLALLDGDFRLRLSSVEATEVTRELLQVMAQYPERICPHLHISMQSGSDSVLQRMRRRWGARRFLDRCRLVRETLDRPALTTDVLVGFPGENDAEFWDTCSAVQAVGFSKLHIFPFSPRPGTTAAQMPGQVSDRIKSERAAHLADLGKRLRRDYFRSLLGSRLTVLVESAAGDDGGWVQGTSCRYAPVKLPGPTEWMGQLIAVTARDASSDGMIATNSALATRARF